ncbi:4060_t:CDS:2 [Ambispora leptoticha]|uniref:4060_t:CDS:1 n=1 Tax=Ambispora leptoticha TaxID=144679 RepID=A0A9N8W994_9GLOM|nr:4060_t:CDS:2 [Ambispora leptoticha]
MLKFQTFVLVTAAMFLVLFWTASAQKVPCYVSNPGGKINVFTPSAGTYSKTSHQVVAWSTNGPLNNSQTVKVCIGNKGDFGCDDPCFKLIAESVPFRYGISPPFPANFEGNGLFGYFGFVQSNDDPKIWGAGPLFKVAAS